MIDSSLAGIPSNSETVDAGECMQLPELGEVFCDWLSVTFQPSADLTWLDGFLTSIAAKMVSTGQYTTAGGGLVRHQTAKRWQSLSFSGGALGVIRSYGLLRDLLESISSYPHKVTRLDAAVDYPEDAAPIIDRLWSVYRSGGVRLNAWNEVPTKSYLSARFDGAISGTFYAGNRRTNKITARVYDKQQQIHEFHRVDIGHRVRYELTIRTDQVTLRDVAHPASVFWHYMSPALLPVPLGVSPWVAGNPFVWEGDKIAPKSIEDRIKGVIYGAGDLNAAMTLCGDSMAMFDYLRKLVSLRISERASKLPGWRASYEV